MLDRLRNLLRPAETKSSRTARLIALESPGRARWTPRDYAALTREGYLANAVVHRAVKLVAENAASCSFLLYEGAAERERHALLDLLVRPNPRQDGAALFEPLYAYLLLAGNAYVEAVTLGGGADGRSGDARDVRELYCLRPDRMRVVPGDDGWAEAYEYSVAGRSVRFDQSATPVPPILHLTAFHPLDDHYGLSALEAGAVAVEGGDGHLRYKMSKESASKTLSVLMQTNFSGRAEVGLTGDDDLHVKVSPDGSTWYESLIISRSSGVAGLGVNGSAGAPALTWSSDPDNGLYRTGANAWSLACAGAQAIGIAASTISIPYSTASTSTTTGALTVGGGGGFAGTVSANAFIVGSTAMNAARRTVFGLSPSYAVLGLGEYSGNNSISLGVDVFAITGGSFSGTGDVVIPKSGSVIAPNAAGNNFVGVIRSDGTNVYVGPVLDSGVVKTNQRTVYGTTGGVTIGAPTGGDKGTGTLNISADIYKNNTAYTNPDFVFEHFYRGRVERFIESPGARDYVGLMPLAALREFTMRKLRLPGIDDSAMGVFDRGDIALRLIEESTLYILELHERVAALEAHVHP